ncbi:MAG: aminopeptidase P family protein [Bacteroidetes bacterium]|nr:aminopeptidase P family protein [Bacteroidota bacterium]MCL2303638.1 aminopeptidase P family protein [Lentimicrobiaceae bacterium]
MNPLFASHIYQERRNKLGAAFSHGVALFLANGESSMNYPANTYRYRQDSNFLYFFGLSLPNIVGVIDFEKNRSILFGDDFTIDDIIWMGDQPKLLDLATQIAVDEVRPLAELSSFLKGKQVHFTPPYRAENKIELARLLGKNLDELTPSVDLIKGIVALREIKSFEEIAQMVEANEIGVHMHTLVMRYCRPGVTERELYGIAEGIALGMGNGTSFPVILSQNGQTLHNHDHSLTLEDGRLLVMDAGVENVMNYCSDHTRTLPVSGTFSTKQREIYETVYQANMAAIANCKPGIQNIENHKLAVTILTEGLQKIGLMKGNIEESVALGAHALFMPHGLGHQIGLDVHDMEDLGENYVGYDDTMQRSSIFGWRSLRMAKTLRPGHVITIEPGIYFIPHLIDIWKKEKKFEAFINYDKVETYKNFGGIRIEDSVLITEEGGRVLGKHLPKSVEEIEATINS